MTGSIQRADLKIFKPELQGNSDEAGGQRSTQQVLNGALNQVFTSITVIDHAQGAVEIEKIYPAIDTPGTERLKDAHLYLSAKPADPLVSVFLVESDAINDASRLPALKEAISSGTVAGNLLRFGLSALTVYQDSLPMRDFLPTQDQARLQLLIGDMIVIAIEYPGNEQAAWPRRQHFAKIVAEANGGYQFAPALPFSTPGPTVSINGTSGCTVLRAVTHRDGVRFHGVTQLTAPAQAGTKHLAIAEVFADLLPVNQASMAWVAQPLDTLSAAPGVLRKTVLSPVGDALHHLEAADLFSQAVRGVNTAILARYASAGQACIEVFETRHVAINNRITLRLSRARDQDVPVAISYVSTKTQLWSSNTPIGIHQLLFNTVSGVVQGPAGTVQMQDVNGELYWFSSGEVLLAVANRRVGSISLRGVISYATGFSNAVFTACTQAIAATDIQFVLVRQHYVPQSFYLTVDRTDGQGVISASSNELGQILGSNCSGTLVHGLVTLNFTVPIDLSTLRYDVTEQHNMTPPVGLYPLDPLRLPGGGRVPMFRNWGVVVIADRQVQAVPSPHHGQTLQLRPHCWVEVTDAAGNNLWTLNNTHYSFVAATGVLTLHGTFSGFLPPLVVANTLSEEALITHTAVQGLTLSADLRSSYPAGATVSSVQVLGDLSARASPVVDMAAWNNNWNEFGAPATASMNVVSYPIELSNQGAINEDWLLLMTSATAFRCIGRSIGQVGLGDTLNDFSPINPRTQSPFFLIRRAAFGAGWQAGEAIRFSTFAAAKPTMLVRSVSPGHSVIERDSITLMLRGNED